MKPGDAPDGHEKPGTRPPRLPETPTKHSAPPSPGVGTPGKGKGGGPDGPGSAGFYRHGGDDPRPERIGPYRVVREIGSGGMGVVYLAVRDDPQFQRRVALKVVRRGMDTAEVVRRFGLERQVLSALNHPNIAALLDGGVTEDGRPYFVMEYVEGEPIADHCDSHRLTVDERLALFRTVCGAVQFAHSNLVVHRDLKPANILITPSGVPKLLDFGIAKLLNPALAPDLIDPTAADLRLMTPEYASPEQVRGDPITTASDVYTLGVLLYELLTGHRPYRLKSRIKKDIEDVICNTDPEKPSTAVSRVEVIAAGGTDGVSPVKSTTRTITPADVSRARESRPERLRRRLEGDLDNIVLMAMRKEPQRRYTSAAQLADDIGRHLNDEPVIARPDRALYRATKFVRRNRGAVTVAALVTLALTTALGLAVWQTSRAEAQRALAETGRQEAMEQKAAADAQRERAQSATGAAIRLAELMEGFARDLESFQSSAKRRELFAESTLRNLQQIEARFNAAPEVRGALARAYLLLGDRQGGIRGASAGKQTDALESYRKALALAESLVLPERPFENASLRISALRRIGDALEQVDAGASLKSHQAALDLAQGAVDAGDRANELRRALAGTTLDVGDVLNKKGKVDEARALFEKSLQLRRELAIEAGDDDPIARRDLAVGLGRVASALMAANRPADALALCVESNRLRDATLRGDQDPSIKRARRDLLNGRKLEARCLGALGRYDDQAESLKAITKTAEEIAALDGEDTRSAKDVADAFEKLGDALASIGDQAGAAEAYRAMGVGVERLRAMKAENIGSFEVSLGSRLGSVLLESGDAPGARAQFEMASTVAEALAKADPRDVEVKGRNAAIMRQQVGDAIRALGDAAGADVAYAGAASALAELAATAPTSKRIAADLGMVASARGWAALDAGRADDARHRFESAVSVLEPLGGAPTATAEYRDALAEALAGMAICDALSGRAAQATAGAARANECASAKSALVFRALSLARFAANDRAGAEASANEARVLLEEAPAGSPNGRIRSAIDGDLKRFGSP